MKKYEITIRMYITKTYKIEAENENEAIEIAFDNSTPTYEEGVDESFCEELVNVELVEDTQ
jgi:hypothetical protein